MTHTSYHRCCMRMSPQKRSAVSSSLSLPGSQLLCSLQSVSCLSALVCPKSSVTGSCFPRVHFNVAALYPLHIYSLSPKLAISIQSIILCTSLVMWMSSGNAIRKCYTKVSEMYHDQLLNNGAISNFTILSQNVNIYRYHFWHVFLATLLPSSSTSRSQFYQNVKRCTTL